MFHLAKDSTKYVTQLNVTCNEEIREIYRFISQDRRRIRIRRSQYPTASQPSHTSEEVMV